MYINGKEVDQMHRAAIVILWLTSAVAQAPLKPNSSAASGFAGHANGNAPAGEVSKLPVRALLYPGATTKIYARLMPFFVRGGGEGHIDVGYSSNDRAQLARQLDDMISRGVDGAILDWYGPRKKHHEQVASLLREESEKRNFEFALTLDTGAVKECLKATSKSETECVIDDMDYAADHYFSSPAYMRRQGRPVMFFFGLETHAIDWQRVKQQAEGHPLLIFRNSGAFDKAEADGGFAWIGGSNEPRNGMAYLTRFYRKGVASGKPIIVGAAYKGFDDSLASWGKGKRVSQDCGQTWLNTFAEVNSAFSERRQLPMLQLLTWNDYEEGTELESGIDDCVQLSVSQTKAGIKWEIGGGNQNAIDHFEVVVSGAGRAAETFSMKRNERQAKLDLPPGEYTIYVKAVGVPFVQNRTSPPIRFTRP